MLLYITDDLRIAELLAGELDLSFNPSIGGYSNSENNQVIMIVNNKQFTLGTSVGYKFIEFENKNISLNITVVDKDTTKTRQIQDLLKTGTTHIINCCQSNPEGQFNFDMLMFTSRRFLSKQKVKRLWLMQGTDAEVKNKINELQDNNKFNKITNGIVTEHIIDLIWDINKEKISKSNVKLNYKELFVLKLLEEREEQIKKQIIKSYYRISITYKDLSGNWNNKSNDDKLYSINDVQKVIKEIKDKNIFILTSEESIQNREHPLLYNQSDIIKEVQQITKTKEIQQITEGLKNLYKLGYITNPDTNSRHLPLTYSSEIKPLLMMIESLPQYKKYTYYITKVVKKLHVTSRVLNNDFIDSTHAIVPTIIKSFSLNLDSLENLMYDLIVKRFLSIFMGDNKTCNIKITGAFDDDNFVKLEKDKELKKGWAILNDPSLDIYKYIEDRQNLNLLNLNEEQNEVFSTGDYIDYNDLNIRVVNSSSRASSRFSLASIVKLMETAGKNIQQHSNRNVKNRNKGIGRVEDRINIIDGLLDKGLVSINDDKLTITETGIELLEKIPSKLKSKKLLKLINDKIVDVTSGYIKKEDVINEHINTLNSIINNTDKNTNKDLVYIDYAKIIQKHTCPVCGGDIIDRKKFIGCKNYPSCTLLIPKVIAQLLLSEMDIISLLTNKETDVITGFRFKNNKNGRAALKLDKESKVKFDFSKN